MIQCEQRKTLHQTYLRSQCCFFFHCFSDIISTLDMFKDSCEDVLYLYLPMIVLIYNLRTPKYSHTCSGFFSVNRHRKCLIL